MIEGLQGLPVTVVALQLYRLSGDRLIASEVVSFADGYPAVDLTLRRAACSGRVEVDGHIENHFADAFDEYSDLVATVALDARSYRSRKYHWMRCRCER